MDTSYIHIDILKIIETLRGSNEDPSVVYVPLRSPTLPDSFQSTYKNIIIIIIISRW